MNPTYRYQFKYPSDWGSLWQDVDPSLIFEKVVVASSSQPNSIVTFKRYGAYPQISTNDQEILTSDLVDFAQYVWEINKNTEQLYSGEKVVSPLSALVINNAPAFEFSATKAFSSPPLDTGGEWTLSAETTFIILHSKNQNFIVSYISDDKTSAKIARTLRFLP